MYNWITVLYTWNLHDIVNQLYFNKKINKFLKYLFPQKKKK